ncbi:methyltransferase domain-containing protein [Desulfovibrio aerotolerans]|uniref:Methyltransferase domain-containing protein n=1 Tax=Solidesulfovibrio aerotolerans TaxID=295255 RepID=A0A7C9IWB6_9BACT|nr:methyltransferase domain-containing protein [Solidesulfovibrio aerotolerans]MYL84663.1 methyltransferase domain-containing protein [Solidesulfovibrio aerotolerans]
MKLIERTECAITHLPDLEDLYVLKNFPIHMGCTTDPPESDIRSDMAWSIGKSSGLIQLKYLIPIDVLYAKAHGSGCVGALWLEHHKAFARFISSFSPQEVLEIGGAHGVLAREYNKINTTQWTILEPNPTPTDGTPARYLAGFFDNNFQCDFPVGAVVHSHVFEHMYEPDKFIKQISDFLLTGKYMFFSVPNMEEMIKRSYVNCINFEHTMLLTEAHIEHLLSKHHLKVLSKEYFKDDHSIFYSTTRDHSADLKMLTIGLYKANKKNYNEYIKTQIAVTNRLNSRLMLHSGPVFLFGAHIFSQYLIAFGLDESKISCILDNDNNKQEKRLYGTKLQVASPMILGGLDAPVVILKAGVYNDEIRTDIINEINASTIFWE